MPFGFILARGIGTFRLGLAKTFSLGTNAHAVCAKWILSVATASCRCNEGWRHPLIHTKTLCEKILAAPSTQL
jgi:hypothetical protein